MRLFKEKRWATMQDVSWLRRALSAELETLRFKEEVIDDLALCVSEIGANIVLHALPVASFIEVELALKGAALRLSVLDNGGSYDGFSKRFDERFSIDIDQESGRGLALVRNALQNVRYRGGNPNRFVGWRSLVSLRPRILIVEDSPSLLDFYIECLNQEWTVVGCTSLEEAHYQIRTSKFDAILADLHLGDGVSSVLLEDANGHIGLEGTPIVFISSDHTRETRDACLRDGGEFYIRKPVQPVELRKTLALASNRASIRTARLYRTFSRHVSGLMNNTLPPQLGAYLSACVGGSATTGGGDLVLRLPRDCGERIVMADVMGHGVAARAWAISLATMVRTLHRYRQDLSSGDFLTEFARTAWDDPALQGAMATMLVADLYEGGIEVASAGHPPPFLVSSTLKQIDVGGPLLGVLRPIVYDSAWIPMKTGERVIFYTDGVDHMDKFCGEALPDWLESSLGGAPDPTFPQTIQSIQKAAEATLGPQPSDDWTIVLLERT